MIISLLDDGGQERAHTNKTDRDLLLIAVEMLELAQELDQ